MKKKTGFICIITLIKIDWLIEHYFVTSCTYSKDGSVEQWESLLEFNSLNLVFISFLSPFTHGKESFLILTSRKKALYNLAAPWGPLTAHVHFYVLLNENYYIAKLIYFCSLQLSLDLRRLFYQYLRTLVMFLSVFSCKDLLQTQWMLCKFLPQLLLLILMRFSFS